MKNYTNITLNSLPDRELEIIGTITAEKMALMREKALNKIKADFETDGFRKGNVPEAIIVQKIGDTRLLEEAAEIALSEEYPNILEEHKVDAIGRPEINITKLGVGSPLEFKVKTSLMPDVKLADYKKIASGFSPELLRNKANATAAPATTDQEIEDVIKSIRENIAHQKVHADAGGGDKHDHREVTDADLPEVNDEFAKMIGGFDSVAQMKEKIKENIAVEKGMKEKDKHRVEILEEIMGKSTIDLPKIIIDGEMEKMLAQFKDDIAKSGISYEDYLKHVKKTEDDLKSEWKDTAVKRAKSQVILNTIAKEEGIAPKEEEVKTEMEKILAQHSGADRFRVRMYVETFMTNELVFQFFENQK